MATLEQKTKKAVTSFPALVQAKHQLPCEPNLHRFLTRQITSLTSQNNNQPKIHGRKFVVQTSNFQMMFREPRQGRNLQSPLNGMPAFKSPEFLSELVGFNEIGILTGSDFCTWLRKRVAATQN